MRLVEHHAGVHGHSLKIAQPHPAGERFAGSRDDLVEFVSSRSLFAIAGYTGAWACANQVMTVKAHAPRPVVVTETTSAADGDADREREADAPRQERDAPAIQREPTSGDVVPPTESASPLADHVPPPLSPARGPPADWGELVRAHDDREAIQAAPDELTVIDIHSL
jgi:hypothetical protein